MADTRVDRPLDEGETRTFRVTGPQSGVPTEATAVVINLTAADPQTDRMDRRLPVRCRPAAVLHAQCPRRPHAANSAIIPVSEDGTVCVSSTTITDILIDVTGWVSPAGAYELHLAPPDAGHRHPVAASGAQRRRRIAAGRSPERCFRVRVAGVRGIPENAKAATLNVTTTGSSAEGFLQVVPCGAESTTSTINFARGNDSANGTTVRLGDGGDVCVTASRTTHVILDITGTWG